MEPVKSAVAEALGKIGDPRAITVLIKFFRDPSKTVRETAGTALISIGQPSVDPLIDCLKDKDFGVRCHAARALGGMTTDYQIGRTKATLVGEAAHIIPAVSDGPKAPRSGEPLGDIPSVTSIENAIWLCSSCHTIIDKDPARYPVSLLLDWKTQAENLANRELETNTAVVNLWSRFEVLNGRRTRIFRKDLAPKPA